MSQFQYNIRQWLCTSSSTTAIFLEDQRILDTSTWSSQPGIRHGEKQVIRLDRRFGIDECRMGTDVNEMRDFIDAIYSNND